LAISKSKAISSTLTFFPKKSYTTTLCIIDAAKINKENENQIKKSENISFTFFFVSRHSIPAR
jgi:hypothetical protein